jgi:hypothetical protein
MFGTPFHRRKGSLGTSVLALGRLKTGQMNRTEEAYSRYLGTRKVAGEIACEAIPELERWGRAVRAGSL